MSIFLDWLRLVLSVSYNLNTKTSWHCVVNKVFHIWPPSVHKILNRSKVIIRHKLDHLFMVKSDLYPTIFNLNQTFLHCSEAKKITFLSLVLIMCHSSNQFRILEETTSVELTILLKWAKVLRNILQKLIRQSWYHITWLSWCGNSCHQLSSAIKSWQQRFFTSRSPKI